MMTSLPCNSHPGLAPALTLASCWSQRLTSSPFAVDWPSRFNAAGLCSTSLVSRSTSALLVALISRHCEVETRRAPQRQRSEACTAQGAVTGPHPTVVLTSFNPSPQRGKMASHGCQHTRSSNSSDAAASSNQWLAAAAVASHQATCNGCTPTPQAGAYLCGARHVWRQCLHIFFVPVAE